MTPGEAPGGRRNPGWKEKKDQRPEGATFIIRPGGPHHA